MKYKIFILTFLILQCSCQTENHLIRGKWLLVHTEAKPNVRLIPILRGNLYQFNENNLYISHIADTIIHSINYDIKENLIRTDSSMLGKIIHISNDSMTIENNKATYNMHFIRIPEYKLNKTQINKIQSLLIDNIWEFYDNSFETKYRIYCSDVETEINDNFNHIVYETQFEEFKIISEYETWTLKEFDENLLFAFSSGQTETNILHITEIDEYFIKGNLINAYSNTWSENSLQAVKNISPTYLNTTKETITGTWTVQNLIKPTIDEIVFLRDSSFSGGFGNFRYEDPLSFDDLLQLNFSYDFKSNGEYNIVASDKIIRKGQSWNVTKDGRFIYLDSKSFGDNFVEILDIKINTMKIKHFAKISTPERGSKAYVPVELEIDLIKNTDM